MSEYFEPPFPWLKVIGGIILGISIVLVIAAYLMRSLHWG